ncbi:phosphatases II [Moniliophthora roreri MCA 2997]|uniref:protein-tyrosine-phosphatase n=1 Tax=Moniliophthora roreri (strain MCA 2997) TaxID=1381753 RepID=V2WW11_MONRO|nr:phosphatases II [Moniliophthora roreri MCA 2997]
MNYHPHRHGSWPNPPTAHPHSAPQSSSSSRHALTLQPPTLLTSPSPLSAPHSLASSTSYASSSTSSSRITPSRAAVLQAASPHVQPSQASEIVPRLYISDLSFAENPTLLAKYRITHILSILPERIAVHPDSDRILGYTPVRMQVCVEDFPFAELAAHLPTTTKFIRDALSSKHGRETRVLVHCAEGISRSVSVVAAFLMAQYGWTPGEAVKYVKDKRKVANPNFGFVKQLYEYGRESLGRRGLVDGM